MEIFTLIIIITIYFIPAIIASKRKHINKTPILLVNLFFGWSLVGWFIALIWAYTSNVEK